MSGTVRFQELGGSYRKGIEALPGQLKPLRPVGLAASETCTRPAVACPGRATGSCQLSRALLLPQEANEVPNGQLRVPDQPSE
jgi:hypothetical protein